MSGIGFDLQLAPAKGGHEALDEEACDDLSDAVTQLLSDFLSEALTRDEELETWEGIDASVIAEVEPDAFLAGKVSFVFQTHWQLGGEAAWHFYRHAVAARWDELSALLSGRGLKLSPPRLTRDEVRTFEAGERVFARAAGELWLVEPDGSFVVEEGQTEPSAPADVERAKAQARERRCGCELCEV